MFRDDPQFDEWQEAILQYRRQVDEDAGDVMSLFVLDTDVLSLLQRGHPQVVARCSARSPGELAITVISLEEQLSGRYSLIRKAKQPDVLAKAYQNLIDTVLFLARLPILPFPQQAIARFEQLVGLKLNVGRMDLRIAAIAQEHQAIVVSRNIRDFGRVPGLVVEDWTQ